MLDALLIAIIKRPRLTGTMGLAVAALLLAVLWWLLFWQSPQRAFADMLANNLATTSVTRLASAGSKTQGVQQTVRLLMGSTNAADWLVTVRQADSAATTESIGTPANSYIRYVQITPSKQDAAKKLNFSKLLNVWGKNDGKGDPSLNHLFDQTVLDISNAPVPPIANLPEEQRQNILAFMRHEQVYTPNYHQVKQQKLGGRQLYIYPVSVKLAAYVRMMQAFAHDEGLASLDTVDPAGYASLPPVQLQFAVDKASHQLAGITYPSSNFSQRYTNWGLTSPIVIPTKSISTSELQSRIQSISAGS